MDREIRARLNAFVKGLDGPLGGVPLDRAIRNDLALFSILRESGATWVQIANALVSAGARRPDNSPISSDHIRSAVSRQLKRSAKIAETPAIIQTVAVQPSVQATGGPKHKLDDRKPANSTSPATIQSIVKATPSLTSYKKKPSNQASASVLEKLARTRKLRES